MPTVNVSPLGPSPQFELSSGIPAVGNKLFFYIAGTTTKQDTYTSSTGSVANTNPVVLDALGMPTNAQIWFTEGQTYKLVYAPSTDSDPPASPIKTWDNLSGINNFSSFSASSGSSLVGFLQSGTGAVSRTMQSKERDIVSVKDFGATGNGTTNDTAAFVAALAAHSSILIPNGTYLISSDLTLADYHCIWVAKNAKLIAGVNSLTFFKSTTNAYYAQVWNASLDGNGYTGIAGFDMSNFRLQAGLFNPTCANLTTAYIMRTGCFGTQLLNPDTWKVPNPLVITAADSILDVLHPTFDNSTGIGGSGAGTGIAIQAGGAINTGVRIIGGFVQGFANGIVDSGTGTKVDGTYFESCTSADISGSAAVGSEYKGTQHFGNIGAAGIQLRNCDGITIFDPLMGSGNRTALYDVDATNTNCTEYRSLSASSKNTPTGTMTYLRSIPTQTIQAPTVITDGSGAALGFTANATARYVQTGKVVTVEADITFPATGSGATAALNLPVAGYAGAPMNGVIGYTDYGSGIVLNGSGAAVNIWTVTGAALTNANMTGKRLAFSITYLAA